MNCTLLRKHFQLTPIWCTYSKCCGALLQITKLMIIVYSIVCTMNNEQYPYQFCFKRLNVIFYILLTDIFISATVWLPTTRQNVAKLYMYSGEYLLLYTRRANHFTLFLLLKYTHCIYFTAINFVSFPVPRTCFCLVNINGKVFYLRPRIN